MRNPPKGFKVRVQVIIEPDGDGFHAYCPALNSPAGVEKANLFTPEYLPDKKGYL